MITHGQDGFLVGPDDAVELADHLKVLALDRERLLSMSLAARRRFLAHPTWEESMGAAVDFLHRFQSWQISTKFSD